MGKKHRRRSHDVQGWDCVGPHEIIGGPEFRQCRLVQIQVGHLGTSHRVETTSWIPEKFAVLGKILKLRDRGTGEWIDGWAVESISSDSLSGFQAEERSKAWETWRDQDV